jgi:hypothetical protein
LATLCAALSACAGDGPAPVTGSEYDSIQQQIFNVSCLSAGCHNSNDRMGNLVLETGVSYDNLVRVLPENFVARDAGLVRVQPFQPDISFLLIKLTGPAPGEGGRMPLAAAPLPAAQIDQVRQWIVAGALPPSGPSLTATASASPTDTPTNTPTPTATGTSTGTATQTISPTGTLPPTATATDTGTPTASATATPTPTPSPPITFAEIQRTIFNPNCLDVGCHARLFPGGNLVLEQGFSYGNLVDVQPDNSAARAAGYLRVTPFDPPNSFLVRKLEGVPPAEGGRMPLGRTPLPTSQIEQVRAWILRGAPND